MLGSENEMLDKIMFKNKLFMWPHISNKGE